MNHLTQVSNSPQDSRTPLMVEVPLASALEGPFLVSSTKGLLWIERKFSNGTVRAAVRTVPIPFLFRDALYQVSRVSRQRGWGNLVAPTAEGVEQALRHLRNYGMEEVEVLFGSGFDEDRIPEGTMAQEVHWVPKGWAVVLPLDRAFVGDTFDFGDGQAAMVIHNAPRAIGIAAPPLTLLEDAGFTPRILKLLGKGARANPLLYVEDLATYRRSDLLRIRGLGRATLKKIEGTLSDRGLSLAQAFPSTPKKAGPGRDLDA